MSNVAFYSTDMRWGGARAGVKVHDGLARGRTTAGGRDYPVPGGMLETAENLRRQYGISRPSRTSWRSPRTSVRWPRRRTASSPRRSSR